MDAGFSGFRAKGKAVRAGTRRAKFTVSSGVKAGEALARLSQSVPDAPQVRHLRDERAATARLSGVCDATERRHLRDRQATARAVCKGKAGGGPFDRIDQRKS
jgi:hypothetical protein